MPPDGKARLDGAMVFRYPATTERMNKTFRLPPRVAMAEKANDPLSIRKAEGIRERAAAFAEGIKKGLAAGK